MSQVIVGPVMDDLVHLGVDAADVVLGTAFYSGKALRKLQGDPASLQFLGRLSVREWAENYLDPPALLSALRRFESGGTQVELYFHSAAHAKVYIGSDYGLIGSSNLTLRGFGGAFEMVQQCTGADRQDLASAAADYVARLEHWTLAELDTFITAHEAEVEAYRQARRDSGEPLHEPDRLPLVSRSAIRRLGSYSGFKQWLAQQNSAAAQEILARAEGRHNLQGHIHRNFYGLRQFFVARPKQFRRFRSEDPDSYKLSQDPATEASIAEFVQEEAVDEDDFELDPWLTYLPEECGGRAGRHGGTIGNLNRMLPLVAKYLEERLRP